MNPIEQLKIKAIEENKLFIEIDRYSLFRWDLFLDSDKEQLRKAIEEPCVIVLRGLSYTYKPFLDDIKESLLIRKYEGKPLHTHTRVYVEEEFGVVEYHSPDTLV